MNSTVGSFNINSITDLEAVASRILELTESEKIYAFEGEMGAGKTTFIKAFCKCLGVAQTVTSPTFSLVNEYSTKQGKTIYHFDFYRIKSIEEALDIGFEEYLSSGNLCLIEWPEKIIELLPRSYSTLKISVEALARTIHLIRSNSST